MMKQRVAHPFDVELAQLYDSYVWHVNAAVAAGRDDLARTLGQECDAHVSEMVGRRRR